MSRDEEKKEETKKTAIKVIIHLCLRGAETSLIGSQSRRLMTDVIGLFSVCMCVCVYEGHFVPAAESDSIALFFFE